MGAGPGGKAMAAHLALMGFPVTLYNRTAEHISIIKERGGITLRGPQGVPNGFARLVLVTSEMREALQQAEVIMVVVPSTAHRDIATKAARHFQDGQIVVLHPGRTGGAIEFAKVLRDRSCQADVTVAETQNFIYTSRSEAPDEARILSMKGAVPLAALPATRTALVLEAVKSAYPQFIDGVNVLHTGLNNVWAVFHAAVALLNAGRIEATSGDFEFYIDGVTPAVGRMLELLDGERVAVATALGVRTQTAMECLQVARDAGPDNLTQAIHDNPDCHGVKAPPTLNHRYLLEDVPMCLVPIVGLGRRHGVSVKAMNGIIRLASIVHGTDYRRKGRRLRRLGIARLSASELRRYVNEHVLYGQAAA